MTTEAKVGIFVLSSFAVLAFTTICLLNVQYSTGNGGHYCRNNWFYGICASAFHFYVEEQAEQLLSPMQG